jgi:aerobic-type carbon monoxide dehydrogenase small subunit (CoxS/CutS family)/CO/xanthine dehydrogenase FAD-binding subunit
MLARGIRSYHRPAHFEEALALSAQGMKPLAGGTRLLSSASVIPNVLDLSALGLDEIKTEEGDLVLGSMVTLQAVIDSPIASTSTSGLLPFACFTQSPSRMIRNMATIGGEAITGAHDSEVVAALLVLNAIFVVVRPDGPVEIPGLRFLRNPVEDLEGGLLESIQIPGAPGGTALERANLLPSLPPLLSVAVAVSLTGDRCARARIALTGLKSPPARILEAEARVEGTACDATSIDRCLEQIATRANFRDDAHASSAYRERIVRPLAKRALEKALARARDGSLPEKPTPWPAPSSRHTTAPSYFTSGRMDLTINGRGVHADVEARTTLSDLLRRNGYLSVKQGCGTGECGSCAVLVDGRPVNSCLTLAIRAHGRHIQTVEGLASDALHPLQVAFLKAGAVHCGFCTPAMLLCGRALLDAIPNPSEKDVRDAFAGCMCRCTGYQGLLSAVQEAAQKRKARP